MDRGTGLRGQEPWNHGADRFSTMFDWTSKAIQQIMRPLYRVLGSHPMVALHANHSLSGAFPPAISVGFHF